MKVLFLNPHVRTDHPVVIGLQSKGIAVLIAANSQEATQLLSLHGANLDLAIVNREEDPDKDGEGGFKFLAKIKSTPQYADLPLIVTSHRWSDSEFAKHQESPQGANAYLKWPFDAKGLYNLIEAVFGGQIPSSDASRSLAPADLEPEGGGTRVDMTVEQVRSTAPPSKGPPKKAPPKSASDFPPANTSTGISGETGGSGGLVLEDASSLFIRTDQKSNSDTSIRLEMPDAELGTQTAAHTVAQTMASVQVSSEASTSVEAPSSVAISEGPGDSEPAISLSQDNSIEAMLDAPAGAGESSVDDVVGMDGKTTVGLPDGFEGMDGKTTVGIPTEFMAGMDGKTTVGIPTEFEGMDGKTTVGIPTEFDGMDGKTTVGLPEGATTVQGLPPGLFKKKRRVFDDEPQMEVSESEEASYAPEVEESSVPDADAVQEMPYLFSGGSRPAAAAVAFALPLGDAVVPGGAANAPDVETLKRYLLLREQDVAVLSTQLKAAKDQVKTMEDQLRVERGRNSELSHVTFEQKRKLDEFEKDKQQALDSVQAEVNDVRFQLKAKADKARVLETQVRESSEEIERLKERVRSDIRKIRVREKELENKLEIMKKDSEALIAARENKIVELKRKLDLLEFNMDLLQDQHSREKENAAKLRERLAKAAQVVRVAGGLLDNPAGASQLAAVLAAEVDPGAEKIEKDDTAA